MADIATCPKCAKQLGLPATIAATDRAECPECRAIFSLSETVQIKLPVARVLDSTEQLSAVTGEPEFVLNAEESLSDSPASSLTALTSWEERLKKALGNEGLGNAPESDNSEDENGEDGASQSTEAVTSSPPSFEIELDLDAPKSIESTHGPLDLELPDSFPHAAPITLPENVIEQTNTSPKTLADFAATADRSALDLNQPQTAALDVEVANDESSYEPDDKPYEAEEADESAEVLVQELPHRGNARRGYSKLAAFAIGPIVGSFLGLYGLLWLQGAKADYVGLSRILPKTMLPAGFNAVEGESSIAESNSLEDVLGQEASTSLSAANELLSNSSKLPNPMKRDESVTPASSDRKMPPMETVDQGRIDEFNALVEAATAALPGFEAGDLSTDAAVKRKGQAYMAFCRLAERFDLANQPGLDPTTLAKARQAAQLYQRVTSQPNLRQELAHIAGRWWEFAKRPNSGIVLAGQVQETRSTADGTICWVKLSEQSTVPAIPVRFEHSRFQTGDQIGVVGRVVSSPSELPEGVSAQPVVRAEYGYDL